MNPAPEWPEIALRLALGALAGALVGFNREGHGRPAGLRTNMLVCMAATVSMIQANLLLSTVGKAPGSFVNFDIMRLPLGILTGMGFIGGGAILRKGDVVMGVTTAATLWFVTIIGLCIGGGQTVLGLVALGIGMFILSGMKRVESRMTQDWRGLLTLTSTLDEEATWATVHSILIDHGFKMMSSGVSYDRAAGHCTLRCDLLWHANHPMETQSLMKQLSERNGVVALNWSPQGST